MTGTPRSTALPLGSESETSGTASGLERAMCVIAATGVVAALLVIAVVWAPVSLASVATLLVLAVAADVDRREMRLPDPLVALAAAPMTVVLIVAVVAARLDVVGAMVLGVALLAAPIAGLHLLSPAAMGFGDVKLAVVLGAAIGVIEPSLSLMAVCAASGTAGVWGSVRRRRAVAFGPFLVVAAIVVLVAAAWLGVGAAAWR